MIEQAMRAEPENGKQAVILIGHGSRAQRPRAAGRPREVSNEDMAHVQALGAAHVAGDGVADHEGLGRRG